MSIAEDIVEGWICQVCCQPLEYPIGIPTTCGECQGILEDDYTEMEAKWQLPRYMPAKPLTGKVNCPVCTKNVKKSGLYQHVLEHHPEHAKAAYKALTGKLTEISNR